jgi:hypothetical protein
MQPSQPLKQNRLAEPAATKSFGRAYRLELARSGFRVPPDNAIGGQITLGRRHDEIEILTVERLRTEALVTR